MWFLLRMVKRISCDGAYGIVIYLYTTHIPEYQESLQSKIALEAFLYFVTIPIISLHSHKEDKSLS